MFGIPRAIEDGAWNGTLRTRLTDLEQRQAAVVAKLAETDRPATVAIYTNAAGLYVTRVADLVAVLNEPEMAMDAVEAIRCLVQQIVLTQDAATRSELSLDLHGDLALLLRLV